MLKGRVFEYKEIFELEPGRHLPGFQLFYTTWGTLNENRDNVIWVCHAFSGNTFVKEWWPGLFGEGKTFDPAKYFIVCANTLGGCYGSTGPLSVNPETCRPYYHQFPVLTNRDVVKAFNLLREHLELDTIQVLIGASLGGQQALEWAIEYPERIQRLVQVAANAVQSPYAIALNETQRMAIETDVTWQLNTDGAGAQGLQTARAVAMLSYRSYQAYHQGQREHSPSLERPRAASYQRYQGEKLSQRFNAYTYWHLTKLLDSHNVGRNRGSVEEALSQVQAQTLVVGVDSDGLFPLKEQKFVARYIPSATLQVIQSEQGHDGFLLESDQLEKIIISFLEQKPQRKTWIPTVF